MIIREASLEDAAQLVGLHEQLDQETKFMLFEPGERVLSESRQTDMIISFRESGNSNIFIAEMDKHIVGHLTVVGGQARRIQHRGHVVIGILKEFTGQGIGQQLFRAMEKWRLTSSLTRLELTVMTHNANAIKLYQRMGFDIEGTKKKSIIVDGAYVDEYYMAKVY